jgi:mannose-6-phosphate isomerase-like protein (cupin superfamily)
MIIKLYRTELDMTNLSRKRTVPDNNTSPVDYRKLVVNKPWGYEYLLYENKFVAIWILFLKYQQATSMHCHPKKKTSLICLHGQVVCSSLDNQFPLRPLDGIIIDSGTFHTTKSFSRSGSFIMEIETPPDKADLVRLKDGYGRENKGYEGKSQMSQKLKSYEYCDFHDFTTEENISTEKKIKNTSLTMNKHQSLKSLIETVAGKKGCIVCFLDDIIVNPVSNLIGPGDIAYHGEIIKMGENNYPLKTAITTLIINN